VKILQSNSSAPTMPAVSPLFAIEADALFSEGRLEAALELCHAGLAEYPEYSSAYALTARILSAMGRNDAARETIESGLGYSVRNAALMRFAAEKGMTPSAKHHAAPHPVISPAAEPDEDNAADDAATAFREAVREHSISIRSVRESSVNLRIIEIVRQQFPQPLTWRANDAGIIPGLKYTSIRLHRPAKRAQPFVPEFPPFPSFIRPATAPPVEIAPEIIPESEAKHQTPLEELALRLERARIPIAREDSGRNENAAVPKFVTDTMAAIYENQGALGQALKAYQMLARNKPENLAFYQAKINELTFRLNNE